MNKQLLQFCFNNQEWIITIVGAIIGSVLSLISIVVWDNHKNKKVYSSFLRLLLSELEENQKRVKLTIENLPKEILDSIRKGNPNIDKGVFIPDDQISRLSWTFPKPYAVDAWKTFISSGFAVELPPDSFKKIYKVYDSIDSINFLSNLTVNIFHILSKPNNLDEQTNKNFDQFCKFGTRSMEVMLAVSIDEAVNVLNKEIG